MIKLMDLLAEGVYDTGILKAVFLAGGSGSGKSYVATNLFGIPKKINLSYTGLKTVNSDAEFEHLVKKYGFDTVGTGKLDIDMWPDDVLHQVVDGDDDTASLRSYAKVLTKQRRKQYEEGRLGMIIDGTARDYGRLVKEKKQLEKLGYDTYMVFVNTSLEVAHKRNEDRERRLKPELVNSTWNSVQTNMKKFKKLFGNNFVEVDNSKHLTDEEATEKFNKITKEHISKFVKKPTKNKRGKKWIENQKILKRK